MAKKRRSKKSEAEEEEPISIDEAQLILSRAEDDIAEDAKEAPENEQIRRATQRTREFERAMKKLPVSAPPARQLAWIRCHPAMTRKEREGVEKVVVTADDIICPPHGIAPSQSAVHQLQHWCNRSEDFFKQMLMEDRKVVSDSDLDDALIDDPDDIKNIDELLATLEGAIVE